MNSEKRVLIIDDDTDLLNALALLLPDSGFYVRTCHTAEDIFSQIEEFKPDVVLLDIHIGPMDGRQICRAIKSAEETCALPIIMLSADESIYNTILSFGANDVISKPFSFNNLTDRIDRQIHQSRTS